MNGVCVGGLSYCQSYTQVCIVNANDAQLQQVLCIYMYYKLDMKCLSVGLGMMPSWPGQGERLEAWWGVVDEQCDKWN